MHRESVQQEHHGHEHDVRKQSIQRVGKHALAGRARPAAGHHLVLGIRHRRHGSTSPPLSEGRVYNSALPPERLCTVKPFLSSSIGSPPNESRRWVARIDRRTRVDRKEYGRVIKVFGVGPATRLRRRHTTFYETLFLEFIFA